MLYLEEEDLGLIFGIITRYYASKEEVPDYGVQKEGIQKLLGVLERVKMEHYTTLIDKVVYLFIQINKGHFFSNGNKRLSLVVALGFLILNSKNINTSLNREDFREILLSIFSDCEDSLDDYEEFRPDEFALYNLSIIVADSHKHVKAEGGFGELKEKVGTFFVETVVEK